MISENIAQIKEEAGMSAELIVVSKMRSLDEIMEAYNCGQRKFGENKVMDMLGKAEKLPKDIHWHMIGHLQTNKVKYIAPFVELIHSVDSLKLAAEIDKQAKKHTRVIPCLLQMHIASEETKFGLDERELEDLIQNIGIKSFQNIKIHGLMGMATNTSDEDQVRREFARLKLTFDRMKVKYFSDSPEFKEISMGMSGDYRIALEEGSTLIRVGSRIFE